MKTKNNIAHSAIGLSGILVLSIPLLLLNNILIARNLSTEEFGRYSFVLSIAAIICIPVTSGLPLLLTREVARYTQRSEWQMYRGLTRSAWLWVMIFSIALILPAILLGRTPNGFTLGVFDHSVLLWSVSMVPFMSLIAIQGGVLRGLGYPVVAALPSQLIQPVIILGGIITLSSIGRLTHASALLWHIFSIIIVFLASLAVLNRIQPIDLRDYAPNYAHRWNWFSSTLAFGAMSAVIVLSTNLAVLLLGLFGQEEAVAQMRVAERGAQLVAFPILMIDGILGPKIVRALEANDFKELKALSRTSARISSIGAVLIAAVLLAYGETLIELTFGSDYSTSAFGPMVILVIGQLTYVLTGSPALLLAMSGHEKQAILGNLVGAIAIIIFSVLLIEDHGASGAAVAVTIGILFSKLYLLLVLNRKLGIWAGVI